MLVPMAAMGQAQASLVPDSIVMGDQAVLRIRNAYTYPSVDMLSQNDIVALDQQYDTASRTQTTTITSFVPGTHVLRLSETDSLILIVAGVEVDTSSDEIRDIASIEQVPYSFWEIFRWILLVMGIGVIGAVVVWIVYRLNHGKNIIPFLPNGQEPDQRTPEQRALDGLEDLRRKRLWQNGKLKEYHTELTDVLRHFIDEVFGIPATEMTTSETLDAIRGTAFDIDVDPLREVLMLADMVKFAKSEPQPHEHDRAMSLAEEFVRKSWELAKPTPEVKEEQHD